MRHKILYILIIIFSSNFAFSQNSKVLNTAKNYLTQTHTKYNLLIDDIQSYEVTDCYVSNHNNITHLYINQTYKKVPIYNQVMNFVIKDSTEVLSCSGNFISSIQTKVNTSINYINPEKALENVFSHKGLSNTNIPKIKSKTNNAVSQTVFFQNDESAEPIEGNLIYYPSKDKIDLCWMISFYDADHSSWTQYFVNAQTGELLTELDWVHECFSENKICESNISHVHTEEISRNSFQQDIQQSKSENNANATVATYNGSYRVFPFPAENPNETSSKLISNPWSQAGQAGTLGWHDDGSVEYAFLRGNNVYAKEDHAANNALGSSPVENDRVFDYTANFLQNPDTYTNAAITNLFYGVNKMHDVWYQYGFNEASGNFQNNNLNRGGNASDFVYADAQDGDGYNNANFVCPPDGSKPRLQMYYWSNSQNYYLSINTPEEIAGSHPINKSLFGPSIPVSPQKLTGELVIANDGSSDPFKACNGITNTNQTNGKIVLVGRGGCNFTTKVKNAQNAGAIACLICNDDQPAVDLAGTDGSINIPSTLISKEACNLLKAMANKTINISLTKSGNINYADGDFDNGIIAHEYAHGISTRLTGGPSNSNCLYNEEQMGEGISDWMALMMTLKASDFPEKPRSIGSYVKGQPSTGLGIRPAHYSTSFEVNNYTYNDLCDARLNVPHGVGFVWATVIWDLTWALIEKHGFDSNLYTGNGGNNLAMQLIVDGLKMQACSPGFVDARDAILLADQVNNNSANSCIIWEVFAKRGLGYSADQGSTDDRCDGIAAFDLPPSCSPLLGIKQKLNPENVLNSGGDVSIDVTVFNNSDQYLSNVVVKDTLPQGWALKNNNGYSISNSNNRLTLTTGSIAPKGTYNFSFDVSTSSLFGAILLLKDSKSDSNLWIKTNPLNSSNWTVKNGSQYSDGKCWFAQNIAGKSDSHLKLTQPITIQGSKPILLFKHFYDTEYSWDGGVVEVSNNGGYSWTDLGGYMIENGYNTSIESNPASAISSRCAFSGNSAEFITTKADLSNFIGQELTFRFRMVSDSLFSSNGWYIDDIYVADNNGVPNKVYAQKNGEKAKDETRLIVLGEQLHRLLVRVFIEGLMSNETNTNMKSDLSMMGLLPSNQPFSESPWWYSSDQKIASTIPANEIADWILFELRDKNNPTIIKFQKAMLARTDGQLMDEHGSLGVDLSGVEGGDYFIALHHYNHLGIVSKSTINTTSTNAYDFTTSATTTQGTDQQKNVNGSYTMIAGDYDHNGIINNLDYNLWRSANALVNQFVSWDGDGNGIVNNLDYNLWFVNRSKVGAGVLYDD